MQQPGRRRAGEGRSPDALPRSAGEPSVGRPGPADGTQRALPERRTVTCGAWWVPEKPAHREHLDSPINRAPAGFDALAVDGVPAAYVPNLPDAPRDRRAAGKRRLQKVQPSGLLSAPGVAATAHPYHRHSFP